MKKSSRIRLKLGEEGKIETMAMDNQGNLLLGVSVKGTGEAIKDPPRRRNPLGPTGTARLFR